MSKFLVNRSACVGCLVLEGMLFLFPSFEVLSAEDPFPGVRDPESHLGTVLPILINKGALLYNDGDPEGCY